MYIFGFDGNLSGLKSIMLRIKENNNLALTHKEIRAYARCLLALQATFPTDIKAELTTLIAALSQSKLAHYDRSFIASKVLIIVEEYERTTKEKKSFITEDMF